MTRIRRTVAVRAGANQRRIREVLEKVMGAGSDGQTGPWRSEGGSVSAATAPKVLTFIPEGAAVVLHAVSVLRRHGDAPVLEQFSSSSLSGCRVPRTHGETQNGAAGQRPPDAL